MNGLWDADFELMCLAIGMLVGVAGVLAADFRKERRKRSKRLAQRDKLRWE